MLFRQSQNRIIEIRFCSLPAVGGCFFVTLKTLYVQGIYFKIKLALTNRKWYHEI